MYPVDSKYPKYLMPTNIHLKICEQALEQKFYMVPFLLGLLIPFTSPVELYPD